VSVVQQEKYQTVMKIVLLPIGLEMVFAMMAHLAMGECRFISIVMSTKMMLEIAMMRQVEKVLVV
tara:strand:+ start:81 stop:275 length:195 start_codon:yes stop_codon:yes gene_type:complete